jgi:hypothetical protein
MKHKNIIPQNIIPQWNTKTSSHQKHQFPMKHKNIIPDETQKHHSQMEHKNIIPQ